MTRVSFHSFEIDLANFKVWKAGTLIFEPSDWAIQRHRDEHKMSLRDEIRKLYNNTELPFILYKRLLEEAGGTASPPIHVTITRTDMGFLHALIEGPSESKEMLHGPDPHGTEVEFLGRVLQSTKNLSDSETLHLAADFSVTMHASPDSEPNL